MKTFVLGDVHGQIKHLRILLNEMRQIASESNQEYEIILTGDILDRGEDSYETFQLIKSLSKKSNPKITHVLGNHDDFFSGSNFGTSQLNINMKLDENGVLKTLESAYAYYAANDTPFPFANNKTEKIDSNCFSLAENAFFHLKNNKNYRILENPKYKDLFERINTHIEKARTPFPSHPRQGNENVKIFKPAKTAHSKEDLANVHFLYGVLNDMKEYFNPLPLITKRRIGNTGVVITHSGLVPTEKDEDGNPTRILTDKEIKVSPRLRTDVLWCREFISSDGYQSITPQERVLDHLICHGHSANRFDTRCATVGRDGKLASINLDAGAYDTPPSVRCVDLQTGRIISCSGDLTNSFAFVKEYQLKKQSRPHEPTATCVSKKAFIFQNEPEIRNNTDQNEANK